MFFYNTKGYYTFRFGTEEEMQNILSLNSVNIGGKRLYLGPWIEGSQFKRNAIKTVSTWIKLADVPHSYWSWEGLGNIAKAVGKPLSLDKQTAQLLPMKYAGILVELNYGPSYPKGVWVPVLNDTDGSIVKVFVGIEYTALPQSCRFCEAFGHSTAKCSLNPVNIQKNKEKEDELFRKMSTPDSNVSAEKVDDMSAENVVEAAENDTGNANVNVLEKDCEPIGAAGVGCPNVRNMENMGNVENMDNMENMGNVGNVATMENLENVEIMEKMDNVDNVAENVEDAVVKDSDNEGKIAGGSTAEAQHKVIIGLGAHQPPRGRGRPPNITKTTCFTEEGEIVSPNPSSSKNKKKRKSQKSKAQNGPFANTPTISPNISQSPSKKGKIIDEEGFTQVPTKRSLRLQGDAIKAPSFL